MHICAKNGDKMQKTQKNTELEIKTVQDGLLSTLELLGDWLAVCVTEHKNGSFIVLVHGNTVTVEGKTEEAKK